MTFPKQTPFEEAIDIVYGYIKFSQDCELDEEEMMDCAVIATKRVLKALLPSEKDTAHKNVDDMILDIQEKFFKEL